MQNNLTPRYLIIGLILAWAIYALLPTWQYQNMTDDKKEELRTSGDLEQIESKIIRQGLDLKGGMYIVLEADIPTLMTNLADMRDDRLEAIIAGAKEKSASPDVDFFAAFEQDVKADGIKLSRYYHQYGASLENIMLALKDEADDAINRVLEILQNRVDQFGVAEPTIQKQGKHRIVVELAGIQDSERARALLQSTALLEFYLVKNVAVTNEMILQLDDIIKLRGNHERYIEDRLWEQENPTLEGMDPNDPVTKEIVLNEKWTAEQIGKRGLDFIKSLDISHKEIIGSTLIEFTHAWFERDDEPPVMDELKEWRKKEQEANPMLDRFVLIHGHSHLPREETDGNLTVFCQGATGLPFDKDSRGAVGFLTVNDGVHWDVVRYNYDKDVTINMLENRKPPFYANLQNTISYAEIRNDI